MARVVVAMSGGVDSAVAALRLRYAGYVVQGLFARSWDVREEQGGTCPAEEDWLRVQQISRHVGINCVRHEFVSDYWNDVFQASLVDGYGRQGVTPNPDVECNTHLKFGTMATYAFETLKADFYATGHYARIKLHGDGKRRRLLRSPGPEDQTLFLSRVSSTQLERVLFPLGDLVKDAVRAQARAAGLSNAERKSSTGLCFVGERGKFGEFISNYIEFTPGVFIQKGTNIILGYHDGAQRFTIGQRAPIGGQSWFVHQRHSDGMVEVSSEPPFSKSLEAADVRWVLEEPPAPGPLQCRFRHRQPLKDAELTFSGDNLRLDFAQPQHACAPGQTVAMYRGDECLGGGIITESIIK